MRPDSSPEESGLGLFYNTRNVLTSLEDLDYTYTFKPHPLKRKVKFDYLCFRYIYDTKINLM